MEFPINFGDNESAFEFACENMNSELSVGVTLPALVLDAREAAGTGTAVKKEPDGTQVAVLRICSKDGGFVALSKTFKPKGPDLNPGDFVAWHAGIYSEELAKMSEDSRSGWVGQIIGTYKPDWVNGSWAVDQGFTE